MDGCERELILQILQRMEAKLDAPHAFLRPAAPAPCIPHFLTAASMPATM